MDTEYPGVASVPTGGQTNDDYYFKLMKENIDLCKIIQLGITIFNSNGEMPKFKGT